MSKFKELVAKDNSNVFINHDEFASVHVIDGTDVLAVIDRSSFDEREALYNYERPSHPAYGVFAEAITMYVTIEELGHRPEVDQVMEIDNETFIVRNSSEDMGMLKVVLEGNRA